jgi:flagellin
MGYLETGMRVLDAASSLLSRLQELAVLGANNTNTVADHEAINAEAEALADEFNRLMTTSAYKGKNVFVTNADSEYVSMGGRNSEMTFGIGTIAYTEMYNSTARTIAGGPSDTKSVNLAHLPSDAVAAKSYGLSSKIIVDADGATALTASKSYVVRDSTGKELDLSNQTDDDSTDSLGDAVRVSPATIAIKTKASAAKTTGNIADGDVITRTATGTVTFAADDTGNGVTTGRATLAEVNVGATAFVKGRSYVIHSLGTDDGNTANDDASFIAAAATNKDGSALSGTLTIGQKIKIKSDASTEALAGINSLIQNYEFTLASETLTEDIEAVQAKVNTARVQAGSQYAALESAVDYTTDLTAQYELGFNTVNDVNFSMETAHLAKNQILQQAATAMLAQANQGQQSLLQLIQG